MTDHWVRRVTYLAIGLLVLSTSVFVTIVVWPSSPSCDSNYAGCVPHGVDVDCEGGGGDGPEYVGRVRVTGTDIYMLDRDHNGIGCG